MRVDIDAALMTRPTNTSVNRSFLLPLNDDFQFVLGTVVYVAPRIKESEAEKCSNTVINRQSHLAVYPLFFHISMYTFL